MNNPVVSRCDRVIRWGVPATGVCIVFAFSMPSYTSLWIKTTLLQCGTAVVFAALLIRAVEVRRPGLFKPLLPFVIPAFVFMLSAVFNYCFVTPSRDTSFDELLVRVPYFMLFLTAALSFAGINNARMVLAPLIGGGLVVALYGVLQHFGADPFHLSNTDRIRSTFGHSNFYAGFLIPVIPMVAAGFDFASPGGRKKTLLIIAWVFIAAVSYYLCVLCMPGLVALRAVVFAVLLAVTVLAGVRLRLGARSLNAVALFFLVNNIFMTQSRSAQIGLGSAVIFFAAAVYFLVFNARSLRRVLALSASALVLAGLVVAGVRHISLSNEVRLNIVSQRKYYVLGALELIKRKPLLGHGTGTFKNNYPLVKQRAAWMYNDMCFEHVSNIYNEPLEVLHDEGAAGFAVYCWLLAVFIIGPFAAVRVCAKLPVPAAAEGEPFWLRGYSPDRAMLIIGLWSGVFALLVSNIFSLSMRYTATGYVFWLFLGLVAALSASIRRAADADRHAVFTGTRSWLRRSLQAAIAVLAAVAVVFSIRLYLADLHLNGAIGYSKAAYVAVENTERVYHGIYVEGTRFRSDPSLWEKAIEYYMKTLRLNPFYLRARYFLGNTFNRRWNMQPECNPSWGDRPGEQRNDAQRALEQYEYVYRQAPHLSEIDYEMGELYQKLGKYDMSIRHYREYIRHMPFFTKTHYALAQAYAAKRDWPNAAEEYKESIDLNAKFTLAYLELSAVYRMLDKNDLSAAMFRKACELVPDRADLMMAEVWQRFGFPEFAAESYRKRLENDSTDVEACFKLGWLYIQRKKLKEAIPLYQRVVKIQPSNVTAYVNLSNLFYETGQLQASRAALQKAVEIDPEYVRRITSAAPTYIPQ